MKIAIPPIAERSAVSAAESITEERAWALFLPHTFGFRFSDSACQPASPIAASASEPYKEHEDVILMPHPDVSASSSRVVTPVVADQQSPRVVVHVVVLQYPNPWASQLQLFGATDYSMESAVVVVVKCTRFMFKANIEPVDIAHHVLLQRDSGTLANWRIDIQTRTV